MSFILLTFAPVENIYSSYLSRDSYHKVDVQTLEMNRVVVPNRNEVTPIQKLSWL